MADVRRWDVEVREHVVGAAPHRVFEVPARSVVTGAVDAAQARLQVLKWCHRDAGAPVWRPYLRAAWSFTSAVAHVETREEELRYRAARR